MKNYQKVHKKFNVLCIWFTTYMMACRDTGTGGRSITLIPRGSHCLSTIMNHQRISTFWFCSPVLLRIHRNLNWKEFLKSRESFMRKVSVCTLTDLNPGFDRPWKKLWIFFVNGTFIISQKKSFGQKKIWISCTGSKVPFWQFFHSAKMALLNPRMKFKFFFAKRLLLKHYKSAIYKRYS